VRAVRNPGTSYVQGMNDLVTPFVSVFLSEVFEGSMELWNLSTISQEDMFAIEADCYWCLCKVLDSIQDHYTFAQPGLQMLCFKLSELVRRIDEPLYRHFQVEGLDFLQISFRWINCLLIRELPFSLIPRLWDTYLAEGDSLREFLLYTCAALLLNWSEKLRKMDFQNMVLFLQHLPTDNWGDNELELILSKAHMWKSMFGRSPSHLNNA